MFTIDIFQLLGVEWLILGTSLILRGATELALALSLTSAKLTLTASELS